MLSAAMDCISTPKVMAEHVNFVEAAKATDKKSRTPLVLAEVTCGKEVEEALVRAIDEKNPEAAALVRAIDEKRA